MARPTTSGLSGGSYGARQQGATVSPQVTANLNAQAGPSAAERLAQALGIVNENVQPALKAATLAGARDQTAAGMNDALLGKVDQQRAAEDEWYARGQKKVLTDKAVLESMAEFERKLQTGEIERTSVSKLGAQFNEFMQQRLGGVLGDPDSARWAYEKLAPFQARLTGELEKEQAEAYRAEAVSTVGAGIRADILNKAPVDLESYKAALLTAGLSKAEQAKAIVDIVGQTAIERGEPELLLQMFPEGQRWADGTPGPRSTPELLNAINDARYYAERRRDQMDNEIREAREKRAVSALNEATIMAADGNIAGARRIVDDLLRKQMITDDEYRSVVSSGRSSIGFYQEQSFRAADIAEFRSQLSEGRFATPREANNAARRLLPAGGSGREMAQLADDVDSFFRSRDRGSDPLVKSYREVVKEKYGAQTWALAGSSEKMREVNALLAYDKAIAAGRAPHEAAEEVDKTHRGLFVEKPKGAEKTVIVNGVSVVVEGP